MASLKGFEPPTHGLEGRCSIQLSYRLIYLERVMGIEPTRPAWKAGILPLNYTRAKSGTQSHNFFAYKFYHIKTRLSNVIGI